MSPESSSDEESQFRSNISIPNLENYRRQHKKNVASKNLKAGNKFNRKTVRFPDLYTPRDTIISNTSSNTNNSSEDDEDDTNDVVDGTLPSFKFTNQANHSDDDDEADDTNNYGYTSPNNEPDEIQTDSSDEDEEEVSSRASKSSLLRGETDITDQSNSNSASLLRMQEDNPGTLKSILRKMSLVDRAHSNPEPAEQSNSDTFLGRVLDNSGSLGLGGGGMVPGALRYSRDREYDEEERIGDLEGPESIEMKKINFAQLSEEAQNLISSHIPDASKHHTPHEGSSAEHDSTANNSTAELLNHRDYDSEAETPSSRPESGDQSFYAPNPDFLLRRDVNNDYQGEDFILDEENVDGYIAPPRQVHAGVLSSLLKLYQNPAEGSTASSFVSRDTGGTTLADENSLYNDETGTLNDQVHHTSTLDFTKWKNGLKNAPKRLKMSNIKSKRKEKSSPNSESEESGLFDEKLDPNTNAALPSFQNARPKAPKKPPTNIKATKKKRKNQKKAQRLRITVHIADILQRQRFIMRMCRALMLFGAPTHRLEEYMVMTSRVLEIDGQFIYFPGCMIVSFGDAATRTSEVHLIRCAQGLNLSKLSDTHKVYKGVIHDILGVEDAAQQLEDLLKAKNLYAPWLCVLFYGLGSAAVCPFAFGGGWIDIPIAFGVGLCVGYLQFYVSSMSNLYSSVFEVTSSIIVSFIARAIGSIRGGKLFCFAAIAQGSLALILPGYIILCGSLELQSRNLVAGSVRMFYAIIYSLFLGFGITLGGALYGWVDKNSTSAQKCSPSHAVNDKWRILFVPMFSICLGLINQARWRQLPVMTVISCIGYIGNYFAGKHFSQVTEFTACIGAFIVGILGNLYSRIGRGMAVSAMLPAIFVQVPSGIASQSSLISGIQTADQITKSNSTDHVTNSVGSLSFGATMVEVSIGISVGLFAAALVVYPFGKKRTGLFTL